MSKWKLVYDEKLKDLKCPYQVYCGDLRIPDVFIDGNKRNGDKIEFSVFCDHTLIKGASSLTPDKIKELPTDKIRFFNHGVGENHLKACRIWATL